MARFEEGRFLLLHWRGAPVFVHWTALAGAFIIGGFRFAPITWLAFILLVLIHEAGHAWMVRRVRARVVAIEVHGVGGHCEWDGDATYRERAWIAAGGVLAQLVLLVVAMVIDHTTSLRATWIGGEMLSVFIRYNVLIMALNLIPYPPLDGVEAWHIFQPAYARVQRWRRRQRVSRASRARLDEMDRLERDAADQPVNPELDAELRRIFHTDRKEKD